MRGSGVGEGDAVWHRAGVLGHVSDSTPLVIPYRSVGDTARQHVCPSTREPRARRAASLACDDAKTCRNPPTQLISLATAPQLQLEQALHRKFYASSRPELPTLGPFSPFFASGVDSRPRKPRNCLDSRPSGLGSGGETRRSLPGIFDAPRETRQLRAQKRADDQAQNRRTQNR